MEVKSPRWRCWQRHYFANKGPSSQSYGFFSSHVWIWELDHKESWAPKNWCFWIVVWKRLFRILCTARRSNQSILKEISPECSLEGLILKLKLQYFGHLMLRADSFEKTMDYYSAITKNAFESVLMRWMKLEPIIQSEVSQKEKHQYNILMHIYGI